MCPKGLFRGRPPSRPDPRRDLLTPSPAGPQLTQVSVLQYGSITTIDLPWNMPLEKAHLRGLVDLMQREGGPSQIGNGVWDTEAASGPSCWHK